MGTNDHIETKVGVLESVVSRLDTSIEKISQVSTDIGKLLAVHSERINQLERSTDRRVNDTKEILTKLEAVELSLEHKIQNSIAELTKQYKLEHESIKSDTKKLATKIETLETWRWFVVGGAMAAAWIVSNSDRITAFIKG